MSFKSLAFVCSVLMLVIFQPSSLQGQNIGDELQWYKTFEQQQQKISVEKLLEKATLKLEEATEIRDLSSEAHAIKEIGLIQLTGMHDYEKAMDQFIHALAIEDSLNLKAGQVISYIAIAQLFSETGDNHKSAELLEEALRLNEEFKNVNVLVFILNKLGKINAKIGKLDEAFENYEHVLNYKDQISEPGIEAEALFNIGHLYLIEGQYNESLQHHKKALAIRRKIGDKRNEAQSLNDIGEVYRLMKNDGKALANHTVSLEIRQALKDKAGVAESYNNIGVLYFLQKNTDKAVSNLQMALEAGQDSQAQDQIRKSYDNLSLCFKEKQDFKKAFEYKELYVAISEFIQNEKNEQSLAETQSRYVIDKKQSQIERLESIRKLREKEIQDQLRFRNFLVAIIGLSVIVAALILYLYLVKRKSNKVLQTANAKVQQQNLQLQELNATKDKFFSIISHDLKGPLNSLTSFSGLLINHTDSLSKDEIKMLAKDLDKSLKNLFALLENLLEWSRSQTGNIEFKPESFDITALLDFNKSLLDAQALNKKIVIVNEQNGELLVHAHKNSINTVIRNFISNAIKFTKEGGAIKLSAQMNSNEVKISIADTGVGMTPDVIQKLFRIGTKHSTKGTADEKGTGLGLILCKEFVEKNGGKIWVESEVGKGSVFYFTLPLFISVSKEEILPG